MAGQIKLHRVPFKSMELFATFRGAGGPDRIGLEFDTCDVVLSHIWHLVEHWDAYFLLLIYKKYLNTSKKTTLEGNLILLLPSGLTHVGWESLESHHSNSHTKLIIQYSNRWFNPFHVHHCVHVYLQLLFLDSFLHFHRLPIATVQSHTSQLFLLHHVRNTQQRRPPCQVARTTKPTYRPLASSGEVGGAGCISLTVRTQKQNVVWLRERYNVNYWKWMNDW